MLLHQCHQAGYAWLPTEAALHEQAPCDEEANSQAQQGRIKGVAVCSAPARAEGRQRQSGVGG